MTVTRYKRQKATDDALREAVLGIARHTPKRAHEAVKVAEATPAEPAKVAASKADRKSRSQDELKEHHDQVMEPRAPMKISQELLARARGQSRSGRRRPDDKPAHMPTMFKPYEPPPGVLPEGAKADMAMDSGLQSWAGDSFNNSWNNANPFGAAFAEGIGFLGYAYLSELTQRPEYRRISERIATEMTRKWIRLTIAGEADPESEDDNDDLNAEDKAPDAPLEDEEDDEADEGAGNELGDEAEEEDEGPTPEELAQRKRNDLLQAKNKKIEDEMKRLDVRGKFREVAEHGGWFGRSHIYVDIDKASDDPEELLTDIGNGSDTTSKEKFKQGSLKNLLVREPIWCYPVRYNSVDPLKEDWYTPEVWFVLGKQVHQSRLLTFVPRKVPDILKPAYAFGGLSMSQMAKPYVDNWLRTRQAVTDLIETFSVRGIYTNAQALLQGGGEEVLDRVDMFNLNQDNTGCFVLDKESEEFFNVSTPLGSLDHLQAQSQEQMSAVSGIPLIVLLGITPSGLNASSEGELRVFYDLIHAEQENQFRDKLKRIIDFVQLNLFGEVDPAIGFEFEPLWSLDEKGLAEVKKIEADTHAIYIDSGVVSPEEVREIVISNEDSPYNGLNPDDIPEPPAEQGLLPPGGKGGGAGGGMGGGGSPDRSMDAADEALDRSITEVAPDVFAFDDGQFDESKHKRDKDGKFSTTGAGGGAEPENEPAAGVEKLTFKSKKEHISHLLTKGTTPKELMTEMGWPSVSMPAQAASLGMKLEKKDGKYFGVKMTAEELAEAKKLAAEKKAAKQDKVTEKVATASGIEPPKVADIPFSDGSKPSDLPVAPEKGEKPKDYSSWLGAVAEAAQSNEGNNAVKEKVTALFKDHPEFAKTFKENAKPAMVAKMEKAAPGIFEAEKPKPPPLSPEEKKKAAKSTTLSMQLLPASIKPTIPGSPQSQSVENTIKEFNEKYAGKDGLSDDQLAQKVQDFKALVSHAENMGKGEAAKKAEIEAETKKKLLAEAKEAAAKAAAAKAEENAKLKAQHKEVRDALGIKSPAEIEAFDAFIDHYGGTASALTKFKALESQAKAAAKSNPGHGFEKLSGFEMACIKSYTGPQSGWINDAIQNDIMTPAQHTFENVLNQALDKLPKIPAGKIVKRGLTMDAATLGKMKKGVIWTHRNFASSSTEGWGGNTKLHITSSGKGGAYVDPISSHKGEDETLFKSNLKLFIDKIESKGGVTHIHCREI